MQLETIARISSPFPAKFGIPRQSNLVQGVQAQIIFEPQFRNAEAVRGLSEFSHIWLIWGFSASPPGQWSPTVRPPRLGGNKRMGVFATRSPFRPNALGLSSVQLLAVEQHHSLGPVLQVAGADLLDGTPIYDIKPYVPYTDAHPNAEASFASTAPLPALQVDFPTELRQRMSEQEQQTLKQLLALDPRPAYAEDAERIYGMEFGRWEIKFRVVGDELVVVDVVLSRG